MLFLLELCPFFYNLIITCMCKSCVLFVFCLNDLVKLIHGILLVDTCFGILLLAY